MIEELITGNHLPSPEELQDASILSSDVWVNCSASGDIESETVQGNPYLKFLKKPEHLAATWRPKDEFVVPSGMYISAAASLLVDPKKTLNDKAKAVTSAIVKDFCQWIENLGGMEKSQMTEDTVQQLFEIGFNTPAARAICVRVKELPAVTESAAQARNLPKRSVSAALRREILRDVNAERKPARLVGFGTALSTHSPLRYKPPRNQTQKRWLDCPNIPEGLESMQVVWEGIAKLRSTRSYCQWLTEHSSRPQPPYLVQQAIQGRSQCRSFHGEGRNAQNSAQSQ
ncbi:uncharacterized protein LOC111870518 [Cryptotermes secundus]|uniref:uncharacterized protein LOC111870518 n=1 Tax=Cryptotermes secundus TaxID=105785 RepID=UPI000CD7C458|nr:uncharacterized protein LOC111870518 [Cryptotermes secundus]